MKIKSFSGLVAMGALMLASMPAWAHHSTESEFDGNKEAVVQGCVLTKVLWTNPHIYFYCDAKEANGKVSEYAFQSGVPLIMHRAGLKKDDFKIGDTVMVTYAPAKDGTKTFGWLKMIKFSDGHVFVYRVASE
jgi:hypothetical protein